MIVLAENNGRIDITIKGEWMASFKTWEQAIFYQEFLKNNNVGGDLDRLYNHVSTMYGLKQNEIRGKSKRSNIVEARVVFSNIGGILGDLVERIADAGKELARKQKRKLTYMSNIYVVKDPANPANEGKVFLFKYGKKIFDKLTAAMQPEFEDEEAIDPFDFWAGANFKLKAKNVAGYRNYDSSEFARSEALLDDDDAMEAIWKKQYSLAELVAADQFKSYDELKKRLDYVLGNKGTPRYQDPEEFDEDNTRGPVKELDEDLRTELNNLQPTRRAAVEEDEDDDALSYFARLAEE